MAREPASTPSMPATFVAVAMVSFRDPEIIVGALKALQALTHSAFSVHVVENGGPAAYEQLVTSLVFHFGPAVPVAAAVPRSVTALKFTLSTGQTVFTHQAVDNLGYAGGVNVAMASAEADRRPDAVWVLNPDTAPLPGALAALVEHAAKGRYGVIGSRLVLTDRNAVQLYGGRWRSWIARGYNIGLGAPADATPNCEDVEAAMDYVSGASMYVTRAFLDQVGPMRERYFLYCEEVDWCLRRDDLRLGYAHQSIVMHAHGATMGSNVSRRSRSALSVYLDERNKLLLTREFFPDRYPIVLLATLLLTVQYAKERAWRNFGYALLGWWSGVLQREGRPLRFFGSAPNSVTKAQGGVA